MRRGKSNGVNSDKSLSQFSHKRSKDLFVIPLRRFLLTFPELARKLNKDDVAELNDAETLKPGTKVIRTVDDDRFGPIEITFEATGGEG